MVQDGTPYRIETEIPADDQAPSKKAGKKGLGAMLSGGGGGDKPGKVQKVSTAQDTKA